MALIKPRIFIVQDDDDANTVLSGILWLKGAEPFKFKRTEECIKKIKEVEGKAEVVIIGGNIAADRNLMFIVNIKKINPQIKVLVIADEDSDKTRILGYGADEFSLKPISPENVADKLFMLISRDTVMQKRY
jgi:DNA-binding NtrC family response regulator